MGPAPYWAAAGFGGPSLLALWAGTWTRAGAGSEARSRPDGPPSLRQAPKAGSGQRLKSGLTSALLRADKRAGLVRPSSGARACSGKRLQPTNTRNA